MQIRWKGHCAEIIPQRFLEIGLFAVHVTEKLPHDTHFVENWLIVHSLPEVLFLLVPMIKNKRLNVPSLDLGFRLLNASCHWKYSRVLEFFYSFQISEFFMKKLSERKLILSVLHSLWLYSSSKMLLKQFFVYDLCTGRLCFHDYEQHSLLVERKYSQIRFPFTTDQIELQ